MNKTDSDTEFHLQLSKGSVRVLSPAHSMMTLLY
jgi:hypothetical protein